MQQILFAEDEPVLGKLVKQALEDEQFIVQWVQNGQEALDAFAENLPAICILDVMMPLMDGFTLARSLRARQDELPILFLTALSETSSVLKGFEAGGNDYLKKPFSIEELLVRVRELLRRTAPVAAPATPVVSAYQIGSYHFNPGTHLLQCPEAVYKLSGKEKDLLLELVQSTITHMDRKNVLLKLWGDDNSYHARSMDVYISRLRKFLSHDPALSIINIRGYGYKLIIQS